MSHRCRRSASISPIARDIAFAFCYEHLLSAGAAQGAEISFFSPLADEAPDDDADAVYLPGGYPELHAGTSERGGQFQMRDAGRAARAARVILASAAATWCWARRLSIGGRRAPRMLGLLPLVDQLCRAQAASRLPAGEAARRTSFFDGPLMAHEFHYATDRVRKGDADRLFDASDAAGDDCSGGGLAARTVWPAPSCI